MRKKADNSGICAKFHSFISFFQSYPYSLQFCCHSRGVRLSQMSSMKSSKDGPAAGAGINAARKGSKEADSGDVGGPGKASAPASISTGRPQPQFKPTAVAPPEPGATPQEPTLAEKVHGCLVDPGGWRLAGRPYVGGLVLGCIDTSGSEKRRILQHFSRSRRFAFFRTFGIPNGDKNLEKPPRTI